MTDTIRTHREKWSSEELEIIYKYYNRLGFKQIAELLPNRSFSAVKNKVKKVKYGK